jgi:16S rRNA (cytosine967-C5)-methyltransferase
VTAPAIPSLPLAKLLSHAADAVQAVRAGRSLNDALAACPADARPGTQALAFHALRWLGSAQAVRARLAPKTPPPPVDALLLTALALLWPPGEPPYPPHTLVDQAVSAARQRLQASAGFINAVLRRFLRERGALVESLLQDPVAAYSHPTWWVEALRRDWPEHWQSLLTANNRRARMSLRVNTRHGTPARYVERLAEAGLVARAVGGEAVVLAEPCAVGRLPGWADGDVSVQDVGAQWAAPLLLHRPGPQEGGAPAMAPGAWHLAPGARVLDACAAPGGKTAHLLELADLDVLALDSDPARLKRVDETLARLRLRARTECADAATTAAWWDGRPFDAILLDAPCSASGIVRRHPDVRWLRRPADIPALARTQARLLDALWPTLAPGGRLLYCTCSVFKAEGQQQIDAFLQRQADASHVMDPRAPGHLLPLADNDSQAHGAPAIGASPDGFYYALLQKN